MAQIRSKGTALRNPFTNQVFTKAVVTEVDDEALENSKDHHWTRVQIEAGVLECITPRKLSADALERKALAAKEKAAEAVAYAEKAEKDYAEAKTAAKPPAKTPPKK